ncbi:MAG: NAD(P)H-binding protein [Paludibacter sp.]
MNPVKVVVTAVATLLCAAVPVSADTLVVYGASGAIGGQIVQEALQRGHKVIGVARKAESLTVKHPQFTAMAGDVTDLAAFKAINQGADAVIISVNAVEGDKRPEDTAIVRGARNAIAAYTGVQGAPYVVQIGGATTMHETREAMKAKAPFPIPEGSRLYSMFYGHLDALTAYRASNIDWSVLTPPEQIEGWSANGKLEPVRTGKYLTATTGFVRDDKGVSRINVADLAVAAVDEATTRKFVRQRFTVGY